MIRGLRITIRGEELRDRIAERIRTHEGTIGALELRLTQRAGDQFFDVRAEDGFKTLDELESERQFYRDWVCCLALLRDGVVAAERYALDRADLRLAELISTDCVVEPDGAGLPGVDRGERSPVDGLRLTLEGEEVHRLLEQRMAEHRRRAERWAREKARTLEEQAGEVWLPEQMCANEEERELWRVEVLEFIHDHIDSTETFRLGQADLLFAELLPEKPSWLEQEESDERVGNRAGLSRSSGGGPF